MSIRISYSYLEEFVFHETLFLTVPPPPPSPLGLVRALFFLLSFFFFLFLIRVERNEKENETESCDKSIRQVRPRKESFQWKTVSAKNADSPDLSGDRPTFRQLFRGGRRGEEEEEKEEEAVPPPKSSRNSFPFKPVTRKHEQPPRRLFLLHVEEGRGGRGLESRRFFDGSFTFGNCVLLL